MARTLGSSPSLRPVLALVLLTGGCTLFKSLVGGGNEQQAESGAGGGGYDDMAVQQQAELQKQDEALQAEVKALWKEIDTEGITSARALALTDLTRRAYESGAVQRGTIDGPQLGRSTLDTLAKAIEAEPDAKGSLELARGRVHSWIGDADQAVAAYTAALAVDPQMTTFAEMVALGHSPAVDSAVLGACPGMRKQVDPAVLADFVEVCLQAAGGEPGKLKWDGVKKDLVAHRKEMERRAEEERVRAAEERKQQEEAELLAAAQAAKQAQYVTAAVFAAGSCSFGDCMHKGWEIRTDAGTIRVSCSFGECLTKGWEADFPDGTRARTSCNFGECMTKGWETSFPDGTRARTSCNFGECATKGWDTSLPDGGTARTSCNFGECYTKGWETSLPDGGRVRCDCNFGDCLQKGTSCQ